MLELHSVLDAMRRVGIMAESLTFDIDPNESAEASAHRLIEEYDTGYTGYLTYKEFIMLAVRILKHHQLSGAAERQAQARVDPYVQQRKSGSGDSSKW